MQANERCEDWVVVDDPDGEWRDGSLVKLQGARVLFARGIVLLPVDTNLLRQSGVGGYAKRAFGSGVPLDFAQPRLSCPISVFATPLHRSLRWAIQLVAGKEIEGRIERGEPFTGSISLSGDSSQRGSHHAGVRQTNPILQAADLGAPKDGGWVVTGFADVSLAAEGVHGFAIYGNMPGVRVAWVAASLVDAS
jgi:hypothetical protein